MSNPNDDNVTHTPGVRKGEEIVKEEGKEPGRKDTGTTGPVVPPARRRAATRAPSRRRIRSIRTAPTCRRRNRRRAGVEIRQ